ncbi:unnamed protein product [Soboliphyme baturini]|uniref:Chromo_2 domain-containing protein n=1 Tax=Soboliphyme baturini TaxID=241478 RepID=A0A183J6Y3_9BILA|nr:unnamed protein product [Soboliphyme baturini]
MRRIKKNLNLSRMKMIAFALLAGCDYCPEGVPSIGKEKAFQYLRELPDDVDILKRLRNIATLKEENASDGELNETTSKFEKLIASHIKMLKNFPDKAIIDEFLRPRTCPNVEIGSWYMPSFRSFHSFMIRKAQWTSEYIISKIFPLITFWYLNYGTKLGLFIGEQPKIKGIFRQRVRNGVPCYEVQWERLDEDVWTQKEFYLTIEEKETIDKTFPHLRLAYLERVEHAKAERKIQVEFDIMHSRAKKDR